MDLNFLKDNFRTYTRDKSVIFKKTSEKWGGFSNMAPGYPLCVNGIYIRSSEALYQACRYPNNPEIQKKIIYQSSPMTAKIVGKPYRADIREDWQKIRVVIMKWSLRVKLAQNYENFSALLKESGEHPIVESSNKDDFWGAKPVDQQTLVGINALGRLLMELRALVEDSSKDQLSIVPIPKISNFLLFGDEIKEVYASDVQPYSNSQDSLFGF